MGKRRSAREKALQVLFELEFHDFDEEGVLLRHGREKKTPAAVREYTDWLVRGVTSRRAEIDRLVQGVSKNWRVSRMPLVDRNILRMAAYELLEEKSMAPAIVINEAIEIAKKYSGDEAAFFVNGVLDAVRKKLEAASASPEVKNAEPRQEHAKKRTPAAARRGQKK